MRCSYAILCAWLASSTVAGAKELLLTGEVGVSESQEFHAGWTGSYRATIQWLEQEGQIVNPGDMVLIFEPGTIQDTIDRNETLLQETTQGNQRTLLNIEEQLIEAEHQLFQKGLLLEIAELKAQVPESEQTRLEFETARFELGKASSDLEQAKEKLAIRQEELRQERQRLDLEVERIRAAIANDEIYMSEVYQRAEVQGPVVYATDWRGNKTGAGQSVFMGAKVASIPSSQNMNARAWVSEVDWPKVRDG